MTFSLMYKINVEILFNKVFITCNYLYHHVIPVLLILPVQNLHQSEAVNDVCK